MSRKLKLDLTGVDLSSVAGGELCVIGHQTSVTEPYLVHSVRALDNIQGSLILVPYAKEIYDADTKPVPDYKPPFTSALDRVDVVFVGTREDFFTYDPDTRKPYANSTFYWETTGDTSRLLRYELTLNGEYIGDTKNQHFTYTRPFGVNMSGKLEVRPIMITNVIGGTKTADYYTNLYGRAPAAPQFLSADIISDAVKLKWEHPDDPSVHHYIIKYHPSTTSADVNSAPIINRVGFREWSIVVGPRIGTYYVQSVNSFGDLSKPAQIITSVDHIKDVNIIDTVDEGASGWSGITHGVIIKPIVMADWQLLSQVNPLAAVDMYSDSANESPYRYYEFKNNASWAKVYEVIVASKLIVNARDSRNRPTDQYEIWLEYRTFNSLAAISTWQDLDSVVTMTVGTTPPSEWRRFDVSKITASEVQFRLVILCEPDIVVSVKSCLVEIDAEDSTSRIENKHISGKTHVSYPYAFMSDNVSIAASMASNTGVKYLIENKDRSGFDITPLDPTNNAVDADFDFVFRGQGREAPNRI